MKGRIFMDNNKAIQTTDILDQLIQNEKDKKIEKLHKLDNAVMILAGDMRSAVYFVNHYISSALDIDINDHEAIDNLICSLSMIPKIMNQLLEETEKAENIVFGVSEG